MLGGSRVPLPNDPRGTAPRGEGRANMRIYFNTSEPTRRRRVRFPARQPWLPRRSHLPSLALKGLKGANPSEKELEETLEGGNLRKAFYFLSHGTKIAGLSTGGNEHRWQEGDLAGKSNFYMRGCVVRTR
ncbi:hypothetical protein Bbelb_192520 [Branchiostoma belcheri]|nr:hypothetical protein Bbelb_192520 [Branchiostoma belcheri]